MVEWGVPSWLSSLDHVGLKSWNSRGPGSLGLVVLQEEWDSTSSGRGPAHWRVKYSSLSAAPDELVGSLDSSFRLWFKGPRMLFHYIPLECYSHSPFLSCAAQFLVQNPLSWLVVHCQQLLTLNWKEWCNANVASKCNASLCHTKATLSINMYENQ